MIEEAKNSLQKAEEAEAQDVSPTIYNYTKNLIVQAEEAFASKDYNDARQKAYRGEAKARELEIVAKEEKLREKEGRLHEKIKKLEDELNRGTDIVELTLEESIVGFEYNNYELDKSSLSVLKEIADVLKRFSTYRIIIIGHTDSVGTSEYNQMLSEKRAKEVLKHMEIWIVKSRMTFIGYGEDRPIADNSTSEGRAKNRRVEFRLLK